MHVVHLLCQLMYHLIISLLQEECKKLLDATLDGKMKEVSAMINDGVDMNAVIHEVCNYVHNYNILYIHS